MLEFKRGDLVKCTSKFGGVYDGRIGTVVNMLSTDTKKVVNDPTGFLAYNCAISGWYRVRFLVPATVEGYEFKSDAFSPETLIPIDKIMFKFNTTQSDLMWRNGTTCKIIRQLTEKEADLEDVGPMFEVQFEDGSLVDVFFDELEEE